MDGPAPRCSVRLRSKSEGPSAWRHTTPPPTPGARTTPQGRRERKSSANYSASGRTARSRSLRARSVASYREPSLSPSPSPTRSPKRRQERSPSSLTAPLRSSRARSVASYREPSLSPSPSPSPSPKRRQERSPSSLTAPSRSSRARSVASYREPSLSPSPSPSPKRRQERGRSRTRRTRSKSSARSRTKSSARSRAKSSARSRAKSSARSRSRSPIRSQSRSSARSRAKSSARSRTKSSARSRAKSSRAKSSARSRSRSPVRSQSRSSARSRAKSSASTRAPSRRGQKARSRVRSKSVATPYSPPVFPSCVKCGRVVYNTSVPYVFSCGLCGGQEETAARYSLRKINSDVTGTATNSTPPDSGLQNGVADSVDVSPVPGNVDETGCRASRARACKTKSRMPSEDLATLFAVAEDSSCDPGQTGWRRNHFCTLCRKHDVQALVRGHKGHCPFTNCSCDICIDTPKQPSLVGEKQAQDLVKDLVQDFRCLWCDRSFACQEDVDVHSVTHAEPEDIPKMDDGVVLFTTVQQVIGEVVSSILTQEQSTLPSTPPASSASTLSFGRPDGLPSVIKSVGNPASNSGRPAMTTVKPVPEDDKESVVQHREEPARSVGLLIGENSEWQQELSRSCGECQLMFQTRLQQARHRVSAHVTPALHECPTCPSAFHSRMRLRVHVVKMHNLLLLACPTCPSRFPSRLLLDAHLVVDHGMSLPLVCPTCNDVCTSAGQLTAHVRAFHPNSQPMKCIMCSRTFDNVSCFLLHHRSHLAAMGRTHCDVCVRWFPTPELVRAHRDMDHRDVKCFVCPVRGCKQGFVAGGLLDGHLLRYHPRKRPYRCACSEKFATLASFSKHAVDTLHLAELDSINYSTCKVCGWGSSDPLKVIEHEDHVHMNGLVPLDRMAQLVSLLQDASVIARS